MVAGATRERSGKKRCRSVGKRARFLWGSVFVYKKIKDIETAIFVKRTRVLEHTMVAGATGERRGKKRCRSIGKRMRFLWGSVFVYKKIKDIETAIFVKVITKC
ncbi:hypothetical protein NDU88_001089 [Pleurodeles waltl]|uniref:Uncharacterized protein n=1 Tax=Pleurodeles waltl TaxID=8319 RepID=A0AAV7VZ29_PLEWA|nr:hypothetical protein NDU88_001089 [Pleurodeles waltl]